MILVNKDYQKGARILLAIISTNAGWF